MSRRTAKLIARTRARWREGRHARLVVLAAVVIGLVASPFAIAVGTGNPLIGGARNPGSSTSADFTRETQIIANIAQNQGGVAPGTGGFTTRQSNKSDSGGGAIYGCRAKAGTEGCIAANNLSNGDAFRFQANSTANAVGQIRFGLNVATPVAKPPFLTNGTGLVKNLNADAVDGKSAEDFAPASTAPLFAVVAADGAISANRGVPANGKADVATTGTPPSATTFTVPFGTDVSACAYTATPVSTNLPGPLAVATGTDKKTVVVTEPTPTSPVGFHLQITC